MNAPKVYLAGPDIFRTNASEIAKRQKAICIRHGLTPLHPMDNNMDLSGDPATLPLRIFRADIDQMLAADVICANMNEFLGADHDSGTCFEVGFFAGFNAALGLLRATRPQKPIYGYIDRDEGYLARIARWRDNLKDDAVWRDWRFSAVDMRINLMMETAMASTGAFVTSGFEDCVACLAADWRSGKIFGGPP
jgi:nucleoside 2-deoxyribosyltransferase